MPTSIWKEFQGLLPSRARVIATVTAHNADGTSSAVTPEGGSLRLWGQLEGETPPYKVFAREGKIERAAPNLTSYELDV